MNTHHSYGPHVSCCLAAFSFLLAAVPATSGDVLPPQIEQIGLGPGGNFAVEVSGRPFKRMELRVSTNLLSGAWRMAQEKYSCTTQITFDVSSPDVTAFFSAGMWPGSNQPVWQAGAMLECSLAGPDEAIFTWIHPTTSAWPLVRYALMDDGVLLAELSPTSRTVRVSGLETGRVHRFQLYAFNAYDDWSEAPLSALLNTTPQDPADQAPQPVAGEAPLLSGQSRFLFSGDAPIQTGVDADKMDDLRMAVLKGSVFDEDGAGLSHVTVTVAGCPEFGQTFTREQGAYDIAVNGGGSLNLTFQRFGYLPAQRTLQIPWLDYVTVPDVVLRRADTNATVVALGGGGGMQAAFGAEVADGDGSRRAGVILPGSVSASIITYDGQTQAVDNLTIRFTEYTVGSNGPAAMPGDLPGTVAYTYAVELGADEAQRKEAGRDVLFSEPVFFYLDNFLGMPAGTPVPMGYYDRDAGAWVPSEDGLSIDLVGKDIEGAAEIAIDPSGTPQDPATLESAYGITLAERIKRLHQPALASAHPPLQHLRLQLRHRSGRRRQGASRA